MAKLNFSDEDKSRMTSKLKNYLDQEFDMPIGTFEAEFFLDFIAEQFGAKFYNKGLSDAQEAMMGRIETINDAIYELEMAE
ncbi:DUF2164 domain-containing protein [Marinomonas transparens]|uniref:DUF2164 domain-containing protein n=1 Tax=Marinomonas transparens TaxID=2795388 RepID=A0A934N2F1_9GAMM|nr:DUF2164 domain-containing protein [Marinomonas transparens]MBJ7537743.1 DUF2164 domain-containing protein [Marinomonas transparens]